MAWRLPERALLRQPQGAVIQGRRQRAGAAAGGGLAGRLTARWRRRRRENRVAGDAAVTRAGRPGALAAGRLVWLSSADDRYGLPGLLREARRRDIPDERITATLAELFADAG